MKDQKTFEMIGEAIARIVAAESDLRFSKEMLYDLSGKFGKQTKAEIAREDEKTRRYIKKAEDHELKELLKKKEEQ